MRRLAFAILAFVIGGLPAFAQSDTLTFYLQNVPLWSQETDFSKGGFSNFYRFRVMGEPTLGDFSFLFAYEQVATFRQNENLGIFVGAVPSGGEWLDLQWTIADEENVLWQHRFDRLKMAWTPTDVVEVSVGRQPVSWATTLFLTPSDPFSPFNPADPFREFRAGVDAARVRVNPGPFSEIDVVVRPTENDHLGEELTTLGRGLTTWKNWEISGWGGSLYGDIIGAFGLAGSLGSTAIRGEGNVRSIEGDVMFRGTVGLDRRFSVDRKDMYIVLEYQHDGLGASSPDEYLDVFQSDPFLRGELQVLGRDEAVFQGSYQIHPLWSLAALGMWNLNDRSFLISPSFGYSASDDSTISGGVFFGFGDDEVTRERPIPSEYGLAGMTVYFSVTIFF